MLGRIVLAVLMTLDGVAVDRLAPSPGELAHHIAAPHVWVSRVGPDAAVGTAAGALLWLTALWLMLGLLVTLAATFAARPHGLLDTVSRRITPALVRRLVTAATGASLALNPVVATAAPTGSSAPIVATSAVAGSVSPALPEETTPGPPLDPEPAAGTVLVKPGDSLWRITAQRLGPSASDQQIAIGWPYWYRTNRRVIGRDPNLLQPGERLTVPTAQEGS
jgi:nucleoid-associated protein YgaU